MTPMNTSRYCISAEVLSLYLCTQFGDPQEKVLQCPLAKQIEQPLPDLTPFLDKPALCEWARHLGTREVSEGHVRTWQHQATFDGAETC